MNTTPKVNTFLLGPAKTATTSLAFWLSQHDDIFVSEPKEARFFEFEYHKGIDFYNYKYFRHHRDEKIVIDANPMHFVIDFIPERIREVCANPRFIICLRHPIERAYSDWWNWKNMRPGRAHPAFNDAIAHNRSNFDWRKFQLEGQYVPFCDPKGGCYIPTYIEAGLYGHLLKRYLDIFGKNNFMLVNFNALSDTPQLSIDALCKSLGISQQNIPMLNEMNMTPKNHKRPTLDYIYSQLNKDNVKFLLDMYRADAELLSSLTNYNIHQEWEF